MDTLLALFAGSLFVQLGVVVMMTVIAIMRTSRVAGVMTMISLTAIGVFARTHLAMPGMTLSWAGYLILALLTLMFLTVLASIYVGRQAEAEARLST